MAKPYRECSVDGCCSELYARGYCSRHYRHLRFWGDPLHDPTPVLSWLKKSVAERDRSSCWEWPFYRSSAGYGKCQFQGERWSAHAAALVLDGRPKPDPPNHFALHSCDNPPCVNPAHLRWGTAAENTADMLNRGRLNPPKGTRNHSAKLTENQVLAIRKDARPVRVIAADYGVKPDAITKIRNRRRWAHL